MSNYELRKHKASDMIKWIVAFVLIFALIASVVLLALQVGGVYDIFKKKDEAPAEVTEAVDDERVVTNFEDSSDFSGGYMMSLSAVSMALDNSTKTLTATVEPASSDQTVDWSIAFKNSSSAWATGKTVTDYATVTPIEDGSKMANVKVLQPFGEQIIVTVKSRQDQEKNASCTLDYVKAVSFKTNFVGEAKKVHSNPPVSYSVLLDSGVGTIVDTLTKFSVKLSNYESFFAPFLQSLNKQNEGFGSSLLGSRYNKEITSGTGFTVEDFLFNMSVCRSDVENAYYAFFVKDNYNACSGKSLSALPSLTRVSIPDFYLNISNSEGFIADLFEDFDCSGNPNAFINAINAMKNHQDFESNCLIYTLVYEGRYLHKEVSFKFIFPEFGFFNSYVSSVTLDTSGLVFGGNK